MDLLNFFKNLDLKNSNDREKLTERLVEIAEQDPAMGDIIHRIVKSAIKDRDEARLADAEQPV